MEKGASSLIISVFILFLFSGIASAHVTVIPNQATEGSYEVFTVRVPNEKEIPTTKLEVKFPSEVNVSRFEPRPGWKYDLTKDSTGKITSVIWTATGEGITSTEFGQFNMQGKVENGAKEISWKAIQTYKDGSTVEWVGAPGSDKPASVTKVTPKSATAPTHGHGEQAPAPDQEPGTHQASHDGVGQAPTNVPLNASIIAVVVSVFSLFLSLRKRV
ncbi:MAG TPA: YcnI family protein [Bacillota bacterium]|nr:YcnI family protein [Bacillota bacterium]